MTFLGKVETAVSLGVFNCRFVILVFSTSDPILGLFSLTVPFALIVHTDFMQGMKLSLLLEKSESVKSGLHCSFLISLIEALFSP